MFNDSITERWRFISRFGRFFTGLFTREGIESSTRSIQLGGVFGKESSLVEEFLHVEEDEVGLGNVEIDFVDRGDGWSGVWGDLRIRAGLEEEGRGAPGKGHEA